MASLTDAQLDLQLDEIEKELKELLDISMGERIQDRSGEPPPTAFTLQDAANALRNLRSSKVDDAATTMRTLDIRIEMLKYTLDEAERFHEQMTGFTVRDLTKKGLVSKSAIKSYFNMFNFDANVSDDTRKILIETLLQETKKKKRKMKRDALLSSRDKQKKKKSVAMKMASDADEVKVGVKRWAAAKKAKANARVNARAKGNAEMRKRNMIAAKKHRDRLKKAEAAKKKRPFIRL